MIGDRVISDLINAELVVADLTDLNPNAFYELGIRHSTERPTIHVAKAATVLPFDNVTHRTIFVDLMDWQSIEQAREQLAKSARAIRAPNYKVSNPITQANASFMMRQSADPRDQVIAEIQERMAALEGRPRVDIVHDAVDAQENDAAAAFEIGLLLKAGKTIDAIRMYRRVTLVDLARSREFLRALKNGEKIEAIKQHRANANTGLKEAKDFVEA